MFSLHLITTSVLYYLVSVVLNGQVEVVNKESLPSVMAVVMSGIDCFNGILTGRKNRGWKQVRI